VVRHIERDALRRHLGLAIGPTHQDAASVTPELSDAV
jgi:hypothetical protein